MPIKTTEDVSSFQNYNRILKTDLGRVSKSPVKFSYFAHHKYDEKEAPLLLVGPMSSTVLGDLKKTAKGFTAGHCLRDSKGNLRFIKDGGAEMRPELLERTVKLAGVNVPVEVGKEEPGKE